MRATVHTAMKGYGIAGRRGVLGLTTALLGASFVVFQTGCSAAGSDANSPSASASAKPLSTCAKELAEEKPPEKATFPKATHEIAQLLPKPAPPAGATSKVTRLGQVETSPDYSQLPTGGPMPIEVGWRRVPVDVPKSTQNTDDWKGLKVARERFAELHKQRMRAKAARAECATERCRQCFDDLADDASMGISTASDEVRAIVERLLVGLRKASPSDADAQLMWAEVLSLKADFLDPNDREVKTLKKEALATFFKGASLQKASPEIAAWLRYGALREADALDDDASIPGVSARGKSLQLEIGKAFLANPSAPTLLAEVAYRTASLGAAMSKPLPASMLRDAVNAKVDPKEESAAMIQLVARTWWARAALAEGNALEAVRALAPIYASRHVIDLTVESNALLADALRDLGRYDGPSLGLVDQDAFADIAIALATTAAQYHDLDLVRQALVAVWKSAPNTLRLPQALRSLTYSSTPNGEAVQAGKELDALMKLDASGRLMSPWAAAMRAHVPPYTDDVIRTNMLATGVYPPAPDPSREADARWRAQDLSQKCHAGMADGPDLEVSVDATGKFTVQAVGSNPDADWITPNGESSLRECLSRLGPVVFRTFGAPVTFKLTAFQRGSSYGLNQRY